MKVKYPIDDHILIFKLNSEYGIQINHVEFIPMGDSAYSYKVNCKNGDLYYLKLFDHKNTRQRIAAKRLTNYLPLTWQLYHSKLFKNIVYPIKKQNGDFKTTFNDISMVLFNFIDGETLAEAYPFSKGILKEIAKKLADIHKISRLIDTNPILKETFDISFESDLLKCISVLESTIVSDNHIKSALREHVLLKKEEIFFMLHLVRELRDIAITENKERVLCHGDIWGGNLIFHEKELYFIDWETVIIAPPEYDLFSFIGEEFDVFFSTYQQHVGQPISLSIDLIRFYSYRHHLRNLTNWLMNILYNNTDDIQNENDLEMILHHCMNRWDSIEPKVKMTKELLQRGRF